MTGEMDTREAIEVALELLEERAAETDTASPEGHRVRLALETLQMLYDQRGCDVFKAGGKDDRLTTLCDVAMFG